MNVVAKQATLILIIILIFFIRIITVTILLSCVFLFVILLPVILHLWAFTAYLYLETTWSFSGGLTTGLTRETGGLHRILRCPGPALRLTQTTGYYGGDYLTLYPTTRSDRVHRASRCVPLIPLRFIHSTSQFSFPAAPPVPTSGDLASRERVRGRELTGSQTPF